MKGVAVMESWFMLNRSFIGITIWSWFVEWKMTAVTASRGRKKKHSFLFPDLETFLSPKNEWVMFGPLFRLKSCLVDVFYLHIQYRHSFSRITSLSRYAFPLLVWIFYSLSRKMSVSSLVMHDKSSPSISCVILLKPLHLPSSLSGSDDESAQKVIHVMWLFVICQIWLFFTSFSLPFLSRGRIMIREVSLKWGLQPFVTPEQR
jgi:hypothetical protein